MSKPRKVYIAIPSRLDAVKAMTFHCLMDAMLDALMENCAFTIKVYTGIEPISDCRNFAFAEFLASDCDDFVSIDDDLAWERGALQRFLNHPVDFVLGAYRHRADPETYPVRHDMSRRCETDPKTGLIEIEGAGFGFARITRRCAERMVAANEHLAYPFKGAPNDKAWMLFQLDTVVNGVKFSEDMLFAKRWRDLGGKVWCDPEITFVHIGNKGFVGHYGDYLRRKMVGVEEEMTKSAA